jgi:predicted outer membrane protein
VHWSDRALQSLTGKDFDRTYARQQALAHHSALAVEQMYATSGDDPNVQRAAASAVSLIQSHLAMADPMAASREELGANPG